MADGNKEKIVIVGDGETAEMAYEYFTYDSNYEVVAFSAERKYLKNSLLFGLPVVPFEELELTYSPKEFKIFIAISFTQLNRLRRRLYEEAKEKDFSCVSYVSSRAFVWRNVKIGENCFILENNVLQSNVRVGNNVFIWSGNQVGHRAVIDDNCFVSSQVVISGFCEIGKNCFLGVNSCLADMIKVAKDCIIGAGAVVIKDTEEGRVYVGNPAKALSHRNSFESLKVSVPK